MAWGPYTLAGQSFDNQDFDGNAYADPETGFPKALEKIVEHVAKAWRSESSTSLTVSGTGTESLTVDANKPFAIGQPVVIARTSDPSGTYMLGVVTAYNESNGAMDVSLYSSKGSGTFSDWTVSLGGREEILVSDPPLPISDGGTGASDAGTARTNLGVPAEADVLEKANNLSDVANSTTSRTNLGAAADADVLKKASNLSDVNNAGTARTNLGLGTAAVEDHGTGANDLVRLDGSSRLPAVDGSQLTNLPSSEPFPSGTKMLFGTAPPVGWTRVNEDMGRVLKLAESGESPGSTGGISDIFSGSWNTNAHWLTVDEIPSHTHDIGAGSNNALASIKSATSGQETTSGSSSNSHISQTESVGGSGWHNHDISTPTYAIAAWATKD